MNEQAVPRTKTPRAPLEVAPLARRAALVLHALSPRDREWLLARMREADRATARTLLAELEALGIPADPALLDEILGAARPAPGSPIPATGTSPLPASAAPSNGGRHGLDAPSPLADADPERLATILRREPPGLVALLLELDDWRWREALLRRLREPLTRAVLGEGRAERPVRAPPALREELVSALTARLRTAADERRSTLELRPEPSSRPASRTGRPGNWFSRLLATGARP